MTTGAAYSTALPLYPADLVNDVGQVYQGPVVLVTDAQCYSACDIFAAGFQDHEIGPVLGVDANTGAGGANVVTHERPAYRVDRRPAQAAAQGSARCASRCAAACASGPARASPSRTSGSCPTTVHALTKARPPEDNVDLHGRRRRPARPTDAAAAAVHLRRGGRHEAQADRHHRLGRQHRRLRQRSARRDHFDHRRQHPDHHPGRRRRTWSGSRASTGRECWSQQADRRSDQATSAGMSSLWAVMKTTETSRATANRPAPQ